MGPGAKEAREKWVQNPTMDYHQYVVDLSGLAEEYGEEDGRKYAKNLNFGILFGMMILTMMELFGWVKEKAERILEMYHEALPFVRTTMLKVSQVVSSRGYIKTLAGRRARLKDPERKGRDGLHPDAYKFLNRYTQGSGADLMKKAMVDADERGVFDVLEPLITVHDELVCSVPKTAEALGAIVKLRHCMEHAYELSVPVIAEPELGIDWAHVKELGDTRMTVSATQKLFSKKKEAVCVN
jgi:DNA polymerase-1